MPRGRPKGSKNKVSKKVEPSRYVIGNGKEYEFPIVREGNTRISVTTLVVGAGSFAEALHDAVRWALEYSEVNGAEFYPLVKYASKIMPDKRYVRRVDCNHAYAESKDYGCWLPILTLEVV